MTFDVEVGERRRVVELTGAGGRYQAIVDGKAYSVDALRVSGSWSLLVGPASAFAKAPADKEAGHDAGERSFEVTFGDEGAGTRAASVNGRVMAVGVARAGTYRHQRARRDGSRDEAVHAAGGPLHVVAPMPGRIVKVLVQVGETVAARQGLVVVEAMKMENELRASRPGIVREIRVAAGALVDARTLLVVIES